MTKNILVIASGGLLLFGFAVAGVMVERKLAVIDVFSVKTQPTPTPTEYIEPTATLTPIPTPTPTRKPRPTAAPTKKPTATPTSAPVSSTPSCPYNTSVPTGAIKVLITSKSTYRTERKIIEIAAQSGCKTIYNATDKLTDEIWKNNGELSFSTVAPGPYAIRVGYNFDGYGSENWTGTYNVDAVSGQTVSVNVELP